MGKCTNNSKKKRTQIFTGTDNGTIWPDKKAATGEILGEHIQVTMPETNAVMGILNKENVVWNVRVIFFYNPTSGNADRNITTECDGGKYKAIWTTDTCTYSTGSPLDA